MAWLSACTTPVDSPGTERMRSDPVFGPVFEPLAGAGGGDALAPDAGQPFPGMMPPVLVDAGARPALDAGARAEDSGSPPSPGPVDLSSCAPPPQDASATAIEAWTLLNEVRLAAGAGCMNMVAELNTSAELHCDYLAQHRSNPACYRDAHTQVAGCAGFTGANVQAREVAAGYPQALAYSEVALSYGDKPSLAIPHWLVTPFHRIPLLDPWVTDMGWGGAAGCDVIDLGRGTVVVPDDTVVVYPYPGQTDLPVSFNGLEAPAPPMPAGGWPSSYPISVHAKDIVVTEHVLTKDGSDVPLEHTWLDLQTVSAGLRSYFRSTVVFYGAPFEPSTTYRVKIVGTHAGGALQREWTFTTGAAQPPRF